MLPQRAISRWQSRGPILHPLLLRLLLFKARSSSFLTVGCIRAITAIPSYEYRDVSVSPSGNCWELNLFAVAIVGILSASHAALAQSNTTMPPHVPLQKAIGQSKTETVPSLIVFNARGASLQGNKLVLNGIAPNSIVFADRPVRAAGHDTTAHIVEDWSKGSDSFAKDPPNATVSVFTKDGSGVKDAVVVLKSPNLEGERLTFDVDVLEGDLNGADGAAAVFIDIIGRPLTPLSFAGAARRTAWRGAYYRGAAIAGAAAVGAAAVGAAAYYHPYGYGYPAAAMRCLPISALLLTCAAHSAAIAIEGVIRC